MSSVKNFVSPVFKKIQCYGYILTQRSQRKSQHSGHKENSLNFSQAKNSSVKFRRKTSVLSVKSASYFFVSVVIPIAIGIVSSRGKLGTSPFLIL
mgnify:CR=1 FL=1